MMRLAMERSCDVLIVGAGIAGISAALAAAEMGCSVILTSSANIFSGSSFYPGTWGLGLIGPENDGDHEDLIDAIGELGCGMADPAMVRTFVEGITPAIEKVRAMGVQLRRAAQGGQREFIPCFDRKHRDWNGIEFDSAREVFSRRMDELGVQRIASCELLELVENNQQICGAVFACDGKPRYFGCKALVLATGGYGSLFRYHLCTEDVSGLGQALALKAGCHLINMEFMQMMPGYLSPAYKTVFNEKAFRFTKLCTADGVQLLPEEAQARAWLDLRSTHGPFTSRLASKQVDLALFRACLEDKCGVTATYNNEMKQHPPELIRAYFDWLEKAKGVTMNDPVQIGIFAHAANGGIRIGQDAQTGVEGLFACGEVTGGMHGADRIGGLSTANGLVFGGRAGRSAAVYRNGAVGQKHCEFEPWAADGCTEGLARLQDIMFRAAMVVRTETGLRAARGDIRNLRDTMQQRYQSNDMKSIAQSRRLEGRITTALCVLEAALLRRESRGSHYRADYPAQEETLNRRIEITAGDTPHAYFVEE